MKALPVLKRKRFTLITWLALLGTLYLSGHVRMSNCTKWGADKLWGGDVRCGFSPAVRGLQNGIGGISVGFEDGVRDGTVFLISPDIVLTAAHLLRESKTGEYKKPKEVIFQDDLGLIRRIKVEAVEVGPFKKTISRARGDWAVLKINPLEDRTPIPIGEACEGNLRIAGYAGSTRPRESECKLVEISAYPYDKSQVIWTSCDAVNGMSGGPILQESDSGNLRSVGVLSLELDRKPPWSFGPAVTTLLQDQIKKLSNYPVPIFEHCADS